MKLFILICFVFEINIIFGSAQDGKKIIWQISVNKEIKFQIVLLRDAMKVSNVNFIQMECVTVN